MSNSHHNAPEPYASLPEPAIQGQNIELLLQFLDLAGSAAQPEIICLWATGEDNGCGAILPADPRLVSAHLRSEHGARGDSKEMTTCPWLHCHSRPIQRRSLVRHILEVHLELLKWTCPLCFRTFSRQPTTHKCNLEDDIFLQD